MLSILIWSFLSLIFLRSCVGHGGIFPIGERGYLRGGGGSGGVGGKGGMGGKLGGGGGHLGNGVLLPEGRGEEEEEEEEGRKEVEEFCAEEV